MQDTDFVVIVNDLHVRSLSLPHVECAILLSNGPWQSWLHKTFMSLPKIIEAKKELLQEVKEPLHYPLVSMKTFELFCPHASKPQVPTKCKLSVNLFECCASGLQNATLNVVVSVLTFSIYQWLVVLASSLGVKIEAFVFEEAKSTERLTFAMTHSLVVNFDKNKFDNVRIKHYTSYDLVKQKK